MELIEIYRIALKEILGKKKRGTQSKLADEFDIARTTMSDFIRGRQSLSESKREQIANSLGYKYEEFIALGRKLVEGFPLEEDKPETPLIVHVCSKEEKMLVEDQVPDYRGVPLYESGRVAAWSNGSAFCEYEKPTSEIIVHLPELKHRSRHKLIAVRVGGDSMSPVIPEKSIIIIDRDDKQFIDNKIYAVAIDEGGVTEIAVKRVRKFEKIKGFALWSENSEYPPRFITEKEWHELCVGRVVWMWRSLEG